MKKNKKVICYFHDDMDGMASAAIVKKRYPQAVLVRCQYGKDIVFEEGYDTCIVVDYSFSKNEMEKLNESHTNFCWIDHHKSAKEDLKDFWEWTEVDGIRRLDKAACELTWEHFYPDEQCPMIIQHIGDVDLWEFNLKNSKEIVEALYLEVKEPEDLILERNLQNQNLHNLFGTGYILLLAKDKRCEAYFKKGGKCRLRADPNLDKRAFYDNCYGINASSDISDACAYAIEQGYNICVDFFFVNDKWIISLRSKGDLDVSEIAKNYGGGGHKNASGFEYTGNILDIIEFIKT